MTAPLFYEDSLGEKLVEKAGAAWESAGSAPDDLIEDQAALDEAQREVNSEDPQDAYALVESDWVPIFGPSKLSGICDVAGANSRIITMPLAAEGIPFVWDPYPPELMPGAATPNQHATDRPFTLYVAPGNADRARTLLTARPGTPLTAGMPAGHDRDPEAASARRALAWSLFVVFLGMDLVAALVWGAYQLYHLLRHWPR